MTIEIEDIYGMKHTLDTEKCREIDFVHCKWIEGHEQVKKSAYYVEYYPVEALDSFFIYITRDEFMKHVS